MRMVSVSKDNDIAVGLRLAGIQSFFIKEDNEIKEKIKELAKDENVGIINVTEEVYEIAIKELKEIEENQELPLIVKIPNSN